jgi:EF-P beta-lysylation protein EpmB
MASLAFQMDVLDARSEQTQWQRELSQSVRDPAELCRLVGLPTTAVEAVIKAAAGLPILVPRPYIARIRPGDAGDPLLLQVLPRPAELGHVPGFTPDPLGEIAALCCPGLLWKYQNRLLILTTQQCAVHCRFCFRRHFLHQNGHQTTLKWGAAVEQIAGEPTIHEAILSGGDPLILSDKTLSDMADRLAQIPHLRRLRIHTRMPIVIPRRVCDELISWIKGTRLSVIMVVQVNHPAEIDDEVAHGLGRLIDAGVPVLSQGVLLAGINDSVDVLADLYERLVDLRVMPYYLHQLDAVAGAAHFEVPIANGIELISRLREKLPGYAVPRYVRETRGGTAKEILCWF